VSVFITGAFGESEGSVRAALIKGAQFAGTLLTILVAHEAGHFIAARIHKVEASLPYFIPLPILSPFGTMGAVIQMRGTIPTRRALLDIGASGPLAGLVFAIPLYAWGVAHSRLVPLGGEDMVGLGSSVLLRGLERLAAPPIPEGMDILLSPIAFGAWAGMFVTMINLLPVGQLDGGHVAYALFGPRQDKIAVVVHRSMLAFFFVSLGSFLLRDARAGFGLHRIGTHLGNSMFWFVWFEVLAVLGTLAAHTPDGAAARSEGTLTIRTRMVATVGLLVLASVGRKHPSPLVWIAWFAGLAMLLTMEAKWGVLRPHTLLNHPVTGAAPLDRVRKAIAIVTLLFFALLFMPTPFAM
jgi:membrane-associated protease RseP (regulator of RpoE activity)